MSVKCRPDKRKRHPVLHAEVAWWNQRGKGVELLHHLFQNNITTILDLKHRRYFSQRRQIVKPVALFRSWGGVNLLVTVSSNTIAANLTVDNGFTP